MSRLRENMVRDMQLKGYTHKVAISNHRIIKLEDNKVTFKWKDYKDNNKSKVMTLDVFEFILRLIGVDYTICTCCGKGHMVRKK